MKEVVKKFVVYNFNELSEKTQRKLLEKEVDYCINSYCENWLENDLETKAEILLKENFGENAELIDVVYDLGYCQGCGAMIEFNLKYYNCNARVKHFGRYYHELSYEVEYPDCEQGLNEAREKQLKAKIENMNEELTKYGYSLIDYNNFIDEARMNLEEQYFLKDGTVFEE